MVWGKQRTASSPSRLYCSSFVASVLNFATSPNSGVKFLGGFLRSEKTIFRFFLSGCASFSWFFFLLLRARGLSQRGHRGGDHSEVHASSSWTGLEAIDDDELKCVDDAEIRLANLYYFVARPHMYVFFGRARRSHVSNVGDQVINPGMRAWLRDRLKCRHIDHCLKIHDGLLPKHSKLAYDEGAPCNLAC